MDIGQCEKRVDRNGEMYIKMEFDGNALESDIASEGICKVFFHAQKVCMKEKLPGFELMAE